MRLHTIDTGLSRAWVTVVLTVMLAALRPGDARCQSSNRYDIRRIEAAFIHNFLDFVTWPGLLHRSGDAVVIGILGDDHFGTAFAEVEGGRVFGKTLTIRKSRRLEDLMDSWILFVSASEADRMSDILRRVEGRPILTVSDVPHFVKSGGIVEFFTVPVQGEMKVRFEINKDRADQAGLKISYQLLSLAKSKE